MKLEVIKAASGFNSQMWRWRVIARNGKIVAASSEGFATRYGAKCNLRSTLRSLIKLEAKFV